MCGIVPAQAHVHRCAHNSLWIGVQQRMNRYCVREVVRTESVGLYLYHQNQALALVTAAGPEQCR
jgi:hypothetical protein